MKHIFNPGLQLHIYIKISAGCAVGHVNKWNKYTFTIIKVQIKFDVPVLMYRMEPIRKYSSSKMYLSKMKNSICSIPSHCTRNIKTRILNEIHFSIGFHLANVALSVQINFMADFVSDFFRVTTPDSYLNDIRFSIVGFFGPTLSPISTSTNSTFYGTFIDKTSVRNLFDAIYFGETYLSYIGLKPFSFLVWTKLRNY